MRSMVEGHRRFTRRRARGRIKQRRMQAKQTVGTTPLSETESTLGLATHDMQARMVQMMEQMTERMEVTAERAVQNAMDKSARTEPTMDTGVVCDTPLLSTRMC